MKIIDFFLILLIKFYKYFLSAFFLSSCRYQPTCSEYFIDCIKLNGSIKGSYLGFKRIFRCHPIKFLGASSGFDPAPKLKKKEK
jgi:putative membrane protein insertion efficiency factor